MELTIPHLLYALFTIAIIVTMIFRKAVVLPALIGIFVVSWVYNGNIVSGFMAIFHANLVAAEELFSIFLIITFMLALLNALRDLGADRRMIKPVQKFMVNGHISFFVLIMVTYTISLFFWPTPAVPMICAMLVPAAIRAGLPAMTAAAAITIAGQGMALSSDYIVQVAPSISAASAGVSTASVANAALILSLITGGIALTIVYLSSRKLMRRRRNPMIEEELNAMQSAEKSENKTQAKNIEGWSKFFAVFVPIALVLVVVYMFYVQIGSGSMSGFEGGDGAAFIGGVAVILLLMATIAFGRKHAFDFVTNHITNGFVFAFKAMGPVIPIAGFFFMGSADFSGRIFAENDGQPPGMLFNLIESTQGFLPEHALLSAFSILIIGIITGLDGSGFSGLPLTGSLAATLETQAVDASTLAAIGQMGSIWTGGGTIVAWSSIVAIAGFCGVSVMDLVRKNFLPVIIGLVAATVIAVIFM